MKPGGGGLSKVLCIVSLVHLRAKFSIWNVALQFAWGHVQCLNRLETEHVGSLAYSHHSTTEKKNIDG
jgi:hypothetical protein